MAERVYCYGVTPTRHLCERARVCQRWTEFQALRHTPAEPLTAELLLCDSSWLSHVPLEQAA